MNRRVFGYVRDGAADGIHVDDAGRVWTGEGSGVTVRSPDGRVLGRFDANADIDRHDAMLSNVANFALAGDKLVILASDRLFIVKLATTVVSSRGPVVD